jgi:M6 family metalloprotease-like protein
MKIKTTQRILWMMIPLLWLGITSLWAVPAQRRPFTVTNSDGTQLTLVMCGDESYHFYTTEDGTPVLQDEQGDWHLAPELTDSISKTWSQRAMRRNARRMQRTQNMRARRTFGYPSNFEGQKKGIVILVDFPQKAMVSTSTPTKFKAMFNEEGYNDNKQTGSVHDYFLAQSYGKFDLTFDVFGPVTTDLEFRFYGGNDKQGNDTCVAKMAAEVCVKADALYNINWKDYDWDGDNEVEQVFIVYAGNGEHASGLSNAIWPHEWSLTDGLNSGDGDGPITLGGCTIDTYAMSCELYSASKGYMDGIGTACHEFSHCLGLPDFYDTSYKGGFGMDAWDVMAAGNYNGQRSGCPSGYTAYERWFAGWLDFTELNEPTTITGMPSLEDAPVAYIIRNDGDNDEAYILENRQDRGWYKYVESNTGIHGMLVSHMAYNEDAWIANEVNSTLKEQRMTIIPANNNYGELMGTKEKYYIVSEDVRGGQLFPGSENVTMLNDTTHTLGTTLLSKNTDGSKKMHKPITNISEADGLISFDFMGGSSVGIDAPSSPTPTQQTYYTLTGTPVATPSAPGIYIVGRRKVVVK